MTSAITVDVTSLSPPMFARRSAWPAHRVQGRKQRWPFKTGVIARLATVPRYYRATNTHEIDGIITMEYHCVLFTVLLQLIIQPGRMSFIIYWSFMISHCFPSLEERFQKVVHWRLGMYIALAVDVRQPCWIILFGYNSKQNGYAIIQRIMYGPVAYYF